jgi:hypothetical protein
MQRGVHEPWVGASISGDADGRMRGAGYASSMAADTTAQMASLVAIGRTRSMLSMKRANDVDWSVLPGCFCSDEFSSKSFICLRCKWREQCSKMDGCSEKFK